MNKTKSYLVPTVIENNGQGERAFDIYSRLLKDRIILLGTPIDDQVAGLIVAQLLFLQAELFRDFHRRRRLQMKEALRAP